MFEKPPTTESTPSPENEPKPLRSALDVVASKYPEAAPERIPTEAEIKEHFDRPLEGREYTDRRKLEDEFGVYLWEVETAITEEEATLISEETGTKEYAYTRKGPHAGGNPKQTTINHAYFDEMGMPCGGGTTGQLKDGEWVFYEETPTFLTHAVTEELEREKQEQKENRAD
jgi:hypothetical protein